MGAMEDVVGLGRSRGLGVVLTTQRTQALNKAVLDLIETLLVMRMLSPRARDAVKDWIQEKHEDDEQGVIASLDSLPTGTAWVWSPLRGILEKVALRRIRTFDSYAHPEARARRASSRPKRKELDLDRARRADVLDTLAWFEMLGIHAPSRAALAPMAGSRPTSGGFKNNLGALRTAGLLDYPEADASS
jgi:hypothetical protein